MENVPRVLIVGSTGYTGRAVVQQLCRAKIHTVAHIRPDSPNRERKRAYFSQLGCTVDYTPWEADSFVDMLKRHQPTHVFSLLGTTKAKARRAAQAGKEATYESVDRDLSLLLLLAIEEVVEEQPIHKQIRYLFLSSMGVTERSSNRYLQARAAVERHIQQMPFPWMIVRPSFISGPDRNERRPMERVGSIMGDAFLSTLSVMGIKQPYQQYGTLSGAQLATGLIAWALDPEAYRKILDTRAIRQRI